MIVGVSSVPGRVLIRLGGATGVLLTTALAAVPGVGQAATPPAPSPAACPTTAPVGANDVAGFTLSALSSGVHGALNSPGLLPVGDAEVGNVIASDVPLSRINVSNGPLVTSLSSPVYPGDTVAHLGTALSTFGLPPVVPNYPVLAESDFPPSPGHGASVSFGTGGLPVQVASGLSTSSESGATSIAHVTSTDVGGAFTTGTSDTTSAVDLRSYCVDASARATTSGIVVAGVVDIAGVTGYAAARSDGSAAVPQAMLQVGKVTVAGLAAFIDRDGVHLAGQQPVGAGVAAAAETTLRAALAATGTTIRVIDPVVTHAGGAATADSGAIEITTRQTLPGIGHPPQGTPPIPLVAELAYGRAQVAVNATGVPASPATVGPPSVGDTVPQVGVPPATGATGAGPTTGSDVPPPVSQAIPPPAPSPGSQVLAASSALPPPGRGQAVPIGWLLLGIAAAVIGVGPMLGYARWQLLEGRI